MSSEAIFQIAQFSTLLIGALGVGVALRSHRRQINAQMFIEFSARFQSVLRTLPPEAWLQGTNGHRPLPPPSEELTKTSLQWFHLVASLFHLRREKYISNDLWRPSQLGLKRILGNPLLQREWFAIEATFEHYPEFCSYIRAMISETTGPAASRER